MAFVPFTAMAEPETLEEALAVIAELEGQVTETSNRANQAAENTLAWYNEAQRLQGIIDETQEEFQDRADYYSHTYPDNIETITDLTNAAHYTGREEARENFISTCNITHGILAMVDK